MGIRRRKGVTFESSGERAVVLDADATVMTTLNPVGAVIWNALDGVRDVQDLARDLVGEFSGVTESELAVDIAEFVDSLIAADLVDLL